MVPHSEPSAKLSTQGFQEIVKPSVGAVEPVGADVSEEPDESEEPDGPPHDARTTHVTIVSRVPRRRTA